MYYEGMSAPKLCTITGKQVVELIDAKLDEQTADLATLTAEKTKLEKGNKRNERALVAAKAQEILCCQNVIDDLAFAKNYVNVAGTFEVTVGQLLGLRDWTELSAKSAPAATVSGK